ncbi:MAG: DUF512 domain-containing protein [Eubacterium sp.]|jgi:putative radical SAM enzyme (TIGR03279 family)|nr:DUF512 domain-containing protein [Eubacterium sp.]
MNENQYGIKITRVASGSPAGRAGIKPGDALISINGHTIRDVLDYRFYSAGPVSLLNISGKKVKIKSNYEDLGLEFESYLMSEKQSCRNNCIFCFISQLPRGLRETLYFKDDDARLSFLQGNYITLTNLSEADVERIIKMRLSVNVSVHTTNPDLRVKMLGNKNAGKALKYFYKIVEAGNSVNCQIVICPKINDGVELRRTLSNLTELYPNVQSIACVPVGLTKFREGLYPVEPFCKRSASDVIDIINEFGDKMESIYGDRVVYPADEFFLLAERSIPHEAYYCGYPQYENGVGMWRSLADEFKHEADNSTKKYIIKKISIATGKLAESLIRELVNKVNPKAIVYGITNDFFGNAITVSGLITGTDIINQLSGKELGERLLISRNMLKANENVFLDDITTSDIERTLDVRIYVVDNNGDSLYNAIVN